MDCETLTAKIKEGHLVINITYRLSFDDDSNLVSAEPEDNYRYVWSDSMDDFLANCFGEYKVNATEFTLTFSDSRDYMRYCLAIDSEY